MHVSQTDRKLQRDLFFCCFFIYSMTMRGNVTGDNYVAYLGVRSMVHQHTLAIEADDKRDWNYAGLIHNRMAPGRGGKFYGVISI